MSNWIPTYLYIKQHSITRKFYFGKTIKDPMKYLGSGLHWSLHIKKHGCKHVVTLWSELFIDQTECTAFALEFSKKMDIVKSDQWLNMRPEDGLMGGATMTGRQFSVEHRRKISLAREGFVPTEETRLKISIGHYGLGVISQSEETKLKLSIAAKNRSPEANARAGASRKGCKHPARSDEYGINMSLAKKDKKQTKMICSHCKTEGGSSNMTRYHFDNCKKGI